MARKFQFDWGKVTENMRKNQTGGGEKDERFYQPKIKEDGTFEAVIRFLPNPDMDITGTPYVTYFAHGFKYEGKWYMENCPSTFGWGDENKCPVCEWNGEDWNAGREDIVRARKSTRKENNVANILIIKDPQTKENEGKVFLYRMGITVRKILTETMDPKKDSIDNPIPIFDPYDGANFKLKIWSKAIDKKNQPQYDKCGFDVVSSIGDDDYIEKVLKEAFPLAPFRSKERFKSYDQLNERFLKLFNQSAPKKTEPEQEEKKSNKLEKAIEESSKPISEPEPEKTVVKEVEVDPVDDTDDGDGDGFFAKLRG